MLPPRRTSVKPPFPFLASPPVAAAAARDGGIAAADPGPEGIVALAEGARDMPSAIAGRKGERKRKAAAAAASGLRLILRYIGLCLLLTSLEYLRYRIPARERSGSSMTCVLYIIWRHRGGVKAVAVGQQTKKKTARRDSSEFLSCKVQHAGAKLGYATYGFEYLVALLIP